tara:strand:- start:319 stop:528 length:210 start_codon:yes stop_codon:yes gene_type:complete
LPGALANELRFIVVVRAVPLRCSQNGRHRPTCHPDPDQLLSGFLPGSLLGSLSRAARAKSMEENGTFLL